MLTRKHVLIPGAGASVDFGFPTGIGLCEEVRNQIQNNTDVGNLLGNGGLGFTLTALNEFLHAFYFSGKDSVDQFLEHRPHFMDVGKAAIAYCLTMHEGHDVLFKYKDNWLRALFARINSSVTDLTSGNLAVVTFNYDRCVEHFLHTAVMNSYEMSPEKAAEILNTIPIIHLHGSLGYLPWQGRSPADTRQFNTKNDHDSLRAGMRNIKVIHEDPKDRDKDFNRAKGLLQEADRILFLGFGYNETNMDRLDLRSLTEKKIVGTAIGLGQQQRKQVESYFTRNIAKAQISTGPIDADFSLSLGPRTGIQLEDHDCVHFIREFMD